MKYNDFLLKIDKPHKKILAIDLKSFYASVECVDRNLDPFLTPLVVADKSRGPGTIVLAVSPYLRALGVPSRQRVYELPKISNIIFATPRMKRYLQMSAKVIGIILNYIHEEDIHVYSIDESFVDITNYAEVKKKGAKEYAKKIMNDIYKTLGLTVTVGIGENIFMAKVAMDLEAKNNKDFLAEWTYDDIPTKLWPISPLSKMWGIGKRLEKRLNSLGFYKIGDIATSELSYLKGRLGVIGEEIYNHSHGIDFADIHEIYTPENTSLSVGQTLLIDYTFDDGIYVLMEMGEELYIRLMSEEKLCSRLYLNIGYTNRNENSSSYLDLLTPCDDEQIIKETLKLLYFKNVDKNKTIRKVNIVASKLSSNRCYQLDLFSDIEEINKKRRLSKVILDIKKKYGSNKITKLSSAYKKSNFEKRHSEIGGHRK